MTAGTSINETQVPEHGGSDPKAAAQAADASPPRPAVRRIPWVQHVTVKLPGWMVARLEANARELNATVEDVIAHAVESVRLMRPEETFYKLFGSPAPQIYTSSRGENLDQARVTCQVPVTMAFYRRLCRWAEESSLPQEELVWQILVRTVARLGLFAVPLVSFQEEYARRTRDYQRKIVIPPIETSTWGAPAGPPASEEKAC